MGKKVMVVDDSRTVRQQVGVVLAEGGYEVIEAADGIEAVDELSHHGDLAMMICDVNMPRMNGLDVLERMKTAGRSDVPVLMLTTEGQPQLIHRAKESGAKGWIVKPFKPELLLAAVRKLVGSG